VVIHDQEPTHRGILTERRRRSIVLNRRVTFAVLNPATEETIAELEEAGVEETDAAVARAKEAFPAWRAVSPADRARLLRRLAMLVEEHSEELAAIESRNVGKPIGGARAEVAMVAAVFHFYAGAVEKHYGETIPVAGGVDMTFLEPLGVVGLIVPWNFPLNISSWKLGPALAASNTVVLKPAELTPLSALRLAELILEAGIPEGVVNVLVGPGRVVGRRLVEHPDVAKIGFTGSTEVGRGVMAGAAGTIKRVTLELGGKSASPTRISNRPPQPRRTPSSTTRGRTAAHGRAYSSSARRTSASSSCSSRRRATSRSATRTTSRRRWDR
jgi:betaine-aldehyde dehydrogenase